MNMYILKDNETTGPFTLAQVQENLESGFLKLDDLYWCEGMENWTPISTLPDLQSKDTSEISNSHPNDKHPKKTAPIQQGLWLLFGYIILLMVLGIVIQTIQGGMSYSSLTDRRLETFAGVLGTALALCILPGIVYIVYLFALMAMYTSFRVKTDSIVTFVIFSVFSSISAGLIIWNHMSERPKMPGVTSMSKTSPRASRNVFAKEIIITDAVAKNIGQAYGFYLGQKLSLEMIEQKFPKLAPSAKTTKMQFDEIFGASVTNMDGVLTVQGGNWEQIKAKLHDQVVNNSGNQTVSGDSASDFIDTVTRRIKGDMPSPILETFLMFHPSYVTNPAREFLDGFKRRFVSDGNEKAQGIMFHLDTPKSWSSEDGNRPHIVRKFVSQNGRGFEMIMVGVWPLPLTSGQRVAEKDIEEMVKEIATPSELKKMLPEGAVLIKGGLNSLDGRPGFFQKYSFKQEKLEMSATSVAVAYCVIYKTFIMQIICNVGTIRNEEQLLKVRFDNFEPLFKLVANSFVIKSQWK